MSEMEKYNQIEHHNENPDFLITIDALTESKLPEFGLMIKGDRLVCRKDRGDEWTDDFSKTVPQYGVRRMSTESGDQKVTAAIENSKPIGLDHYPQATRITLKYTEGVSRKNMLAEYNGSPYIDYHIFKSDDTTEHYNIEWDGFKRPVI